MMLLYHRYLIFALLSLLTISHAQETKTTVFTSGEEGYKSFRIPAIILLPDGDLLAFCEGRVNSAGDFGNVDIVMKRSSNKGKSWSNLEIIVDNGSLQAGNSAPVVDLLDTRYPEGRIFLFYNTGNNSEGEIRKGNGLREVWYKTSTDNGATWSNSINITARVHRPKQPEVNPDYNFKEDWRTTANTPGHAIQLESGEHAGRIFIAANHSCGEPQNRFLDYRAHAYYTDDHGETFHISENVDLAGSNESTAAELSAGKVMMNSRNQRGDIRYRIVSVSNDGGESWDSTYFDYNLPDPVCEGSLLSFGGIGEKKVVAFCNPANKETRNDLTLRISFDEGKSWLKNYLIDRFDAEKGKDYTAYSDLVKLPGKSIGILYERNDYSQIVFTVVNWDE